MQETRGVWGDVQAFSYIRDKNRKTWRVELLTNTRARLVDRDGKQVDILRPPDSRPVHMLIPTDEEARFTLAAALGARILASRDLGGTFRCPLPDSWDLDTATWHMERFHRHDCTGHEPLDQLLAIHDGDEDPAVTHIHTEDA